MASTDSRAVRWIRALIKIQLFAALFFVGMTILLAIFHPSGGYTLDNGFFEDFGYGFISRMQGEPASSVYPVFLDDPGYEVGIFLSFVIFPGLTLLALNKKKRKLFTFGAALLLINGFANAAPLGIIQYLVILILSFQKSTKNYFKS